MSKRTSKPAPNRLTSIRRTTSAVAVAVVAAVAVSACGSSSSGSSSSSSSSSSTSSTSSAAASNGVTSKTADQILSTAIKTAEAAKSVHVAGAIKSGSSSVGLDLSIVQGTGASGTISEGSASFKLVDVGGSFYIQPDPAFLLKFAHTNSCGGPVQGQVAEGKLHRRQLRKLR